MRTLTVFVPVLAVAALAAGCSGMGSGSTTTSAMGAGPAQQTVMCRDGYWSATTAACGDHGGVERVMNAPTAR